MTPSFERLVEKLATLPGIGPKSAARIAESLLTGPRERVRQITEALLAMVERVRTCVRCHAWTEQEVCAFCLDPGRSTDTLMVVEHARDVLALERAGFHGRYHVLGGLIAPLDGKGPETLRIDALLARLEKERVKEVVLGLPPKSEGETTILYLTKVLAPRGLTVTRLAAGLPMGAELEYTDGTTLSRALEHRSRV